MMALERHPNSFIFATYQVIIDQENKIEAFKISPKFVHGQAEHVYIFHVMTPDDLR